MVPVAEPVIPMREVTVRDVLLNWRAAECDLHEVFGVDVEDRVLLQERSWRWLEVRLKDLINRGPRLGLALRAG